MALTWTGQLREPWARETRSQLSWSTDPAVPEPPHPSPRREHPHRRMTEAMRMVATRSAVGAGAAPKMSRSRAAQQRRGPVQEPTRVPQRPATAGATCRWSARSKTRIWIAGPRQRVSSYVWTSCSVRPDAQGRRLQSTSGLDGDDRQRRGRGPWRGRAGRGFGEEVDLADALGGDGADLEFAPTRAQHRGCDGATHRLTTRRFCTSPMQRRSNARPLSRSPLGSW